MKRLLCALLSLGVLCSLMGCRQSLPKPAFPLEEAVVTATVEQLGLPWSVSPDETFSSREENVCYVLRHQTQVFPASGNATLPAGVVSSVVDGKRVLMATYISYQDAEDESFPPPFAWEDWKEHIVFATLLYGGFPDEEAVYQAFASQEMPPDETHSRWDAQISGFYCIARYQETGTPPARHGQLLLDIYESKALYEKMEKQRQKARDDALPEQTKSARSG